MFSNYLDPGGSEGGLQLRRFVIDSFKDERLGHWTGEEFKVLVALLPVVIQSGEGLLKTKHAKVRARGPTRCHPHHDLLVAAASLTLVSLLNGSDGAVLRRQLP